MRDIAPWGIASGLDCQHRECGQDADGDHDEEQTHCDLVAALSALITAHELTPRGIEPNGVVITPTLKSTGLHVGEIFLH